MSFYKLKGITDESSLINTMSESMIKVQNRNRNFSYISNLRESNPIANYPYLMYNFYIRPYIWEYQTGFFRIFNSFFAIIALYILLSNFKLIWHNEKSRMLLLIVFILISVYAIGSSDLYQSDRHRSKFIPLLVSLVAIRFRRKYSSSIRYNKQNFYKKI
jgi:hypothetical protein